MIEEGATHVGVATDHVIESFRNELWPGYKTGAGHRAGAARAVPSARGRAGRDGRRGVADGRARGGRRAGVGRAPRRSRDTARREGLHLDAGQGSRAVRARRPRRAGRPARRSAIRDAEAVRDEVRRRARADSRFPGAGRATRADGYPGIPGIGAVTAARLLNRHGAIEDFPPEVLGDERERSRCCSRISRRCAPMPRSSATRRSCNGRDRRRGSARGHNAWARRDSSIVA